MARKNADAWDAIEADYTSGKGSIRQIANRHGLSDMAIRKRAALSGWVRKEPDNTRAEPVRQIATPPRRNSDVAADPAQIADDGRGLVHRMMDELDAVTSRRCELEDMIIAATSGDESGKRQDSMLRAVSLPERANTLKTLALALKSINEASTPQGVKAKRQEKAGEVAGRFRAFAPPDLKVVS